MDGNFVSHSVITKQTGNIMSQKIRNLICLLGLLCLVQACGGGGNSTAAPTPAAEPPSGTLGDGRLNEKLEEIRADHGLPALAAFVVKGAEIAELSAVGKRSQDAEIQVTNNDMWHIGSITKSMTATLAGRMVDEGLVRWNSTIVEIFPEWDGVILDQYRPIELQQLLSMTGGMSDKFNDQIGLQLQIDEQNDDLQVSMTQRYQGSSLALSLDHEQVPGGFLYTNASYVIAAAMLEKVGQQEWSSLLNEKVFAVLNITEFGIGAPGIINQLDQPLGHDRIDASGIFEPIYGDLPLVWGPAGLVHISLQDMTKYAILHLQGLREESDFLAAASFEALYRPRSPGFGGGYALGWIIENDAITHNGSNGIWIASLIINPQQNTAVFIVANSSPDAAAPAVEDAAQMLAERILASST